VRVLFEIDPDGGGPAISQKYWSSRFSLAQGVTKTPLSYTLFDSDVDTNAVVTIIGVGMDNPADDEYNY
jgi:hypothetical protein